MFKNRHFIAYFITSILYLGVVTVYMYNETTSKVKTESSKQKVLNVSLSTFVPPVIAALPLKEVEKKEEVKEIVKKVKKKLNKTIKKEQPKPKPIVKKKVVPKQELISKKKSVDPVKVNKFYQHIRRTISKNRTYPKMAKRRRIQGDVDVSFTILKNGKVSNIVLKGPKAFHNSAKQAIVNSFPINVKNSPVQLPTNISFILRYRIR